MGNTSLNYFFSGNSTTVRTKAAHVPRPVTGKVDTWQPSYGWNGFTSYPYLWGGTSVGSDVHTLQSTSFFNEDTKLLMNLYQDELDKFERDVPIEIPFFAGPGAKVESDGRKGSITVRRFTETKQTWQAYQDMGRPQDSYGMPYTVPIGMVALEHLAGFPIFIGTAHNYGNEKWGGLEFMDVVGSKPDIYAQYTFLDYDPVTGVVMRQAYRPQITLRVERGPLFVNLVGSQQRCSVPTRYYLNGNAYGCYIYIPLLWYEEARLISNEEYFKLETHYYSRPDRFVNITNIGLSIGIVFIFLGLAVYYTEIYHQNRFRKRVYID